MEGAFEPRARAVEAARLLSYFILDLIAGTRGLEIFEAPAIAPNVTHHMAVALNRMAVSHLVVTLAKWSEFYRRYASILPADVRNAKLAASSTSGTLLWGTYLTTLPSGR